MTALAPPNHRLPDRPHLLLIASGDRAFREYLLRPLAEHYRVHLFCRAEAGWERPYLDGWTVLPDLTDTRRLIAAARVLDAQARLDGVLCWDEASVIAAAQVTEALGLPGTDSAVVLRCQDKYETRRLLAEAGVPQPNSVLVTSVEQALDAAAGIGYPVVLKPRDPAASMGVVLVASERELREQFALATDSTVSGLDISVLVEENADGPEISVDCAVFHGEVLPVCLAHKQIGFPPYFEEVGHLMDGADPMLADDGFREILQQAHAALGFTDGFSHTEFRLTPLGPKVIEVNPRLGGDLIPYLGLRTTGIDPALTAAAVAVGRRPQVSSERTAFGAVRFCYVPHEMTIGTIGFDGERMPNGVDLAVTLAQPGERQAPPPAGSVSGRIALITAVGDNEADVRAVIAAAEAALQVAEAPAVTAPVLELPLGQPREADVRAARQAVRARGPLPLTARA
ncbi:MAG TPA: ATP-grasp domain-containing protein [Jatrophihabitans sp.]|nr:ATP-grasp domain-containing protein [Jatrophihabitans sp.]